MHYLGHSTVRVELAGLTVLTDPVLTDRVGPLRRVVPTPHPRSWSGVDLVLISHLHSDHLHLPSLRLLGPDVRIIVPRGAGAWLRSRGFRHVQEIAPGEEVAADDLRVSAVHAEHSGHRWGPRLTHGPHVQAVGHLIEAPGCTVYVSGDTALFEGMELLGRRGIDVAVLPVWGWGPSLGPGHLDPADAAEATARLRPRIAVPVHWGTLSVRGATALPRLGTRMRTLLVQPPHAFATAVADRGLDTHVAVTRPGHPVVMPARTDSV